jgi:hypothetical protein
MGAIKPFQLLLAFPGVKVTLRCGFHRFEAKHSKHGVFPIFGENDKSSVDFPQKPMATFWRFA